MIEVEAFPVLETERLILRQVTKNDANSLLTYLSDIDVMKYVGLEPFKSIDDALDEISWYKSIFEKGTGIRWGISLKGQEERSEEHTSELQSRFDLVCRLLLEK